MKRPLAIFLGAFLATSVAFATTYVRVEKDGTKTYSDRPLPGGHPVDLQPAQTYSAPAPSGNTGLTAEQQGVIDAANFRYQSCSLSPANNETLHNPEMVTVSLNSTPRLRFDDQVSMSIDGRDLSSSGPSATVTQPERGSHTVNARVTDPAGRLLCETSTTFHVQRASLYAPARQPPPRPPRPPKPTPH